MIKKLLDLKKMQLNQQLVRKQQLNSQIFDLEIKIQDIETHLAVTGVKAFGSIGDFKILAIHKETMKHEKIKFLDSKNGLTAQISAIDKKIAFFQKEVEQYNYLFKEKLKNDLKVQEKKEEINTNEYIQAQWVRKNV